MHLVLTHCGKEWRAQRGLLGAYTVLVFGCLCLGFLLLPNAWWTADGNRSFALACFVAAGVIGVVGFAAPSCVTREFGPKGDQFVRRLPGALAASFGGKLLFLLLAAVALPLLGLACGELFLQAIGQWWDDLYRWHWDGSVGLVPPWPMVWGGLALLLAPWVWAVGTAMPAGRMAFGGTILLVLVIGLGVAPVLRQNPNLEYGIAWHGWLWAVGPAGVVVAGIAWVRGRRGGGAARSARVGFGATLLCLIPPGAWLSTQAWRYRHPDPRALADLRVHGTTEDLRFALVVGNEHELWRPVTFRIDLVTGAAEQVAGLDSVLLPAASQGNFGRWWIEHGRSVPVQRWYDLATGERTPLVLDARGRPILSAEQQRLFAAARRAATQFRAPGGRRMWIDDGDVCLEQSSGTVERYRAPEPVLGARAEGHALVVSSPERRRRFDAGTRTFTDVPADATFEWWLVGEVVLARSGQGRHWHRQAPGGTAEPCLELRGARVVGLVDDERVLAVAADRSEIRLFLFRPTDAAVEVLRRWPPDAHGAYAVSCLAPISGCGSLLPRDRAGRVWLAIADGAHYRCLRLDPATRELHEVTTMTLPRLAGEIVAFGPDDTLLLRDGARIDRVDVATGARTTLFPRSR